MRLPYILVNHYLRVVCVYMCMHLNTSSKYKSLLQHKKTHLLADWKHIDLSDKITRTNANSKIGKEHFSLNALTPRGPNSFL